MHACIYNGKGILVVGNSMYKGVRREGAVHLWSPESLSGAQVKGTFGNKAG